MWVWVFMCMCVCFKWRPEFNIVHLPQLHHNQILIWVLGIWTKVPKVLLVCFYLSHFPSPYCQCHEINQDRWIDKSASNENANVHSKSLLKTLLLLYMLFVYFLSLRLVTFFRWIFQNIYSTWSKVFLVLKRKSVLYK